MTEWTLPTEREYRCQVLANDQLIMEALAALLITASPANGINDKLVAALYTRGDLSTSMVNRILNGQ